MAVDLGLLVLDLAEGYAEMKIQGFLSQFSNLTALFNPLAKSTSSILMNLLANMTTPNQPSALQELGGYNIKLDLLYIDPGAVHPPRFAKFDTDFAMNEDDVVSTAQWSWLNATSFGYEMKLTGVYTDDLGEVLVSPEPEADGTQAWYPNATVFGQDSAGVWFDGTWTTHLTQADIMMMAWRKTTLPEEEKWRVSVTHPVRKGISTDHCGEHHCSGYTGQRPPVAMAPGVERIDGGGDKDSEEGRGDEVELIGVPGWAKKCFETPEAIACLSAAIEARTGDASKFTTGPL